MDAQSSTHWTDHLAAVETRLLAIGAILFALIAIIRRLRAGQRGQAVLTPDDGALRSLLQNGALSIVNSLVFAALFAGAFTVIRGFWTAGLGVERVPLFGDWPFAAQVFLLMVLFDFVNYWSHRILHRPFWWGVHSLHHSDAHMGFSTAFRVHIFELLQMAVVSSVLIGWTALPPQAAALAYFVRAVFSLYAHSDLPIDHGRFRRLLVSPNYHRWHHADDPSVYGQNLADMFPIWDIAFGTHYDPGRCDLPLGVSDAPSDVVRGQWFPFIYWARRGRALLRRARLKSERKAP